MRKRVTKMSLIHTNFHIYDIVGLLQCNFIPFSTVSFHRLSVEIDLTLACCCELNTALGGGAPAPLVTGVGVDIRAGDLFPATFPDKGPELPLRGARTITGGPHSSQVCLSSTNLIKRVKLQIYFFLLHLYRFKYLYVSQCSN